MIIIRVDAKIIKDSRNQKTIAVSVNGCKESSSPNGKSIGEYETHSYYKSLKFCVNFLNKWDEKIEINKFEDLIKLEEFICKKLKIKSAKEFGANSLYAFESAILKALAHKEKKELFEIVSKNGKIPFPVGNVIGGGLHSSSIKQKPNFQEFLIIPFSKKISENYEIMKFIYSELGIKFKLKKVNDEGAWLVSLSDGLALESLNKVRNVAENRFNCKIGIGIDAAASTLFMKNYYKYNNYSHTSDSQLFYIKNLISGFNLYYVEDPFEQNDFNSFSLLVGFSNKENIIVGDDLVATQYTRLLEAIKRKSINAVIVKPNQNGSLLELKKIFDFCKKHNIKTIMSHRSGETLDDALADYAVGFGADYIKCGVATKWREVKLKRLIEIERSL
jgi:enolase